MLIERWTTVQNFAESFEDLSPAQINAMSFEEYSRRTGRPTHAESAATALDRAHDSSAGQVPQQLPAPVQEPQGLPQGLDLASLTMEQYAAVRGQLGVGGREYGRGALDGGSTADWIAAAQRKGGRSGWQGGNVVEPPRLEGRFVNHDEQRDNRTVAQRFSNQANAFNL